MLRRMPNNYYRVGHGMFIYIYILCILVVRYYGSPLIVLYEGLSGGKTRVVGLIGQ